MLATLRNGALLALKRAREVDNCIGERAMEQTAYNVGASTNIRWHEGRVSREDREALLHQRGAVLWFTGLSGSGKSTVAHTLEHALNEQRQLAYVLDGDNVRHGLNSNLGFSRDDRQENVRRVGEVSKLFADCGALCLVSFISPYKADRQAVRDRVGSDFIEVYMHVPLEVCEKRDPKGLYQKAREGKISGFTGIDDPYEAPDSPEIRLTSTNDDGSQRSPEELAAHILSYLRSNGFLSSPNAAA